MTALRFFGALLAALFIAAANAQLPHTFSSGTTAKAAEVNANFAYVEQLANGVRQTAEANALALADVIDDLSITQCQQHSRGAHPISHQPVVSAVGQQVVAGGKTYVISAIPFVEHSTGARYRVLLPVMRQSSSGNPSGYGVSATVSTSHVGPGYALADCATEELGEFPATISFWEIRHVSITNRQASNSGTQLMIWWAPTVLVGQTIVNINVSLTKEEQTFALLDGDFDASDSINWSAMTEDAALVQEFDSLIDYVAIQTVP